MLKTRRHIWIPVVFSLLFSLSYAQESSILDRQVELSFNENTLLGHVDNLQVQENITLAFNSSRVDLAEVIILPKGPLELTNIIKLLFHNHQLRLTPTVDKVLITFLNKVESSEFRIRGYLKDRETGEILVGASVIELTSLASTFTNESGFFSLAIPVGSNRLNFYYLGYEMEEIENVTKASLNVFMDFDNEMDQVLIKGSISDNYLLGSGGAKIDLALSKGFQSMNGDNDLIKAVRILPEVQSGNEGQTGLYVRGGSPDQNLILFEGIPMYEVSHTAGFSSIFIEESIREVDFISNGFPARYGGRLSSVLNVQLKEGNKGGLTGSAQLSLPEAKLHLEGPLFSSKTTFNLSGRISYIGEYLNEAIGDIVNYDNIELDYYDVVAKITHNFSPTQKISFSFYDGDDNLSLFRSNVMQDSLGSTFLTDSKNGIKWGSTVWNLKATNIVNDKMQLAFNIGGIQYSNDSQASFKINSIINGLESPQELELISHSQIKDLITNINFDYYWRENHRIKFGGGWIHHEYNPALIGNDTITEGSNITLISTANKILADEVSLFIEDTYTPHKNWQVYGGLHYSGYNIGEGRYRNLQPRFSSVFTPNKTDRFSISYSKMIQYVHLLVNPGIGLPSDFWVPSTERVRPESANQFSISYSRKLADNFQFSLSGYTKRMDNVLEYRTPVDLFFTVVNSTTPPSSQTDPEWQNHVITGKSHSKGLEFKLQKTSGILSGWLTYALSKTSREFGNINEGQPFPYKYDRRHDVNVGVKYKMNAACSFAVNYSYGTGNAFSLALEGFTSPFGIVLINGGERNNYRFPAFHHLDLQFNYEKHFSAKSILTFNLGLYNAYNRKNAYYIYIYDSPINTKPVAIKTSLFPILPNLSIGYSF